jgi:hypothetical protein
LLQESFAAAKSSQDLFLISSPPLKSKIIFNFKRLGKALA